MKKWTNTFKKLYKFKESSQTNTNIRRSAERRKVCKMVASGNMFEIINSTFHNEYKSEKKQKKYKMDEWRQKSL